MILTYSGDDNAEIMVTMMMLTYNDDDFNL